MPEQTYPPYATGALTVPRQLNRWLDKNPQNGGLQRTQAYITLPSFAQNSSTWNGYSDIVFSFNFTAPNNFSLKQFQKITDGNYDLCISYRVGSVITRYLLWDSPGSSKNPAVTPYTGQTIKKNFRLEVWNTSQGIASQASSVNLYTSVTGQVDYRWGSDFALSNGTTNTSFSVLGQSGSRTLDSYATVIPPQGVYPVSGFVTGQTYTYTLINNIVIYSNAACTTLILNTTGTFVASQPTYYAKNTTTTTKITLQNTLTGTGYAYTLPLTFPSTSVSTTN